jgi:hypothetical protein
MQSYPLLLKIKKTLVMIKLDFYHLLHLGREAIISRKKAVEMIPVISFLIRFVQPAG